MKMNFFLVRISDLPNPSGSQANLNLLCSPSQTHLKLLIPPFSTAKVILNNTKSLILK